MLWVAEVGSAHKGNKSLAFEYIRAFSEAGATHVKFQFGWTREVQELFGLEYNPIRYIDEWIPDLKKWCDYFNVKLMASVWNLKALFSAEEAGMKYYKIGYRMFQKSQEFTDLVKSRHRKTFVSGDDVFCISEYPVYPERFYLPDFIESAFTGYSDHTHGIEACLLAVASGATYIEKHVCLDKTDLATKDTPFSATPAEFAEMVRIGNGMRRLLDV